MITETEKEILFILHHISIFHGMDETELIEIMKLLEPVVYPPDTLIIEEGTQGDSMYILKSGTVNVSKKGNTKDSANLGNLYSGSYFGELSLIDNLPRSADVRTIEEAEIFRLDRDDFEELIKKNSNIARIFYKNCLNETFLRFRDVTTNFTFSQHVLKEKSASLDEINKDLSLAQKIQSYFINRAFLDSRKVFTGGIVHQYVYQPCIEIGGDFLSAVRIDENKTGIMIADFEGHGITAALGTGVLKSAFTIAFGQLGNKPVKLMKFLNKHFVHVIHQLYATCYYAVIDTEEMKIRMAKAGHHHPLFWKHKDKSLQKIDCIGIGLGIVEKGKFGEVEYDIERGDKILFFTDGIIEQVNDEGDMYTKQRLKEKFVELIEEGNSTIAQSLFKDLRNFAGTVPFEDDVTLFLLEI